MMPEEGMTPKILSSAKSVMSNKVEGESFSQHMTNYEAQEKVKNPEDSISRASEGKGRNYPQQDL
jgi:hypothetical protein